jgi:hypothetical protein
VLSLAEIIDMAGCVDRESRTSMTRREAMVILKCDIEGAEIHLFRHMDEWEDRVDYMILELHTEFLSAEDFRACLARSRYRWRMEGDVPAGAVLAVISLERLEPKTVIQGQQAAGF